MPRTWSRKSNELGKGSLLGNSSRCGNPQTTPRMKYQVKDWDANFENDRSRSRKQCSFVCVPNKQHGMGFCRIMAEPDGSAIYGIWHCIVGACSQQKTRNGWLTESGDKSGTAWGAHDLALKFRRPVEEISRALQFLSSERVGWLICHESNELEATPRQLPANSPPTAIEGRKEEKELNEGKEGREESRPHFLEAEIPSWEEFWGYCQSVNCGLPNEAYAKDKWEAANQTCWVKMRDWRAYARRCKNWYMQDATKSKQPEPKQMREVIDVKIL